MTTEFRDVAKDYLVDAAVILLALIMLAVGYRWGHDAGFEDATKLVCKERIARFYDVCDRGAE